MPRNNIIINIESNNSPRASTSAHERSEEEPKERQSKRQKVLKKKLPAEKDAILKSGQSTGTKIKHHAQDLYFGKQYHKLDNVQKDSISNGFNSILNLTDNRPERNG